jgi:outer membrane protein OmpA-like peptidoglycan-associated protein
MFTRQAWYSQSERVHVGLSSVNFRKSYSEYRQCLASLLPVNFDQIAKSRLRFPSARWELTRDSIRRLDTIVNYVKADPSVTGFFVDGHTDDRGRRLANLDLSKKRAEAVTKYLIAKGIDEKIITTRYHGERYPMIKNNSRSNRTKNRRVTIRLDREKL